MARTKHGHFYHKSHGYPGREAPEYALIDTLQRIRAKIDIANTTVYYEGENEKWAIATLRSIDRMAQRAITKAKRSQ